MNNNKKKKVTTKKNAHTTDMDGTNKKDEKYERSVSLTLFTCIQTLFDFQTLATSASRRPSSHKYPRSHRFRFRIQFFFCFYIYFSRTVCVVVYFSLLLFLFFFRFINQRCSSSLYYLKTEKTFIPSNNGFV